MLGFSGPRAVLLFSRYLLIPVALSRFVLCRSADIVHGLDRSVPLVDAMSRLVVVGPVVRTHTTNLTVQITMPAPMKILFWF